MATRPENVLNVYLGNDNVAILRRTRGGLELNYTSDAVSNFGVGGLCLSMSLPVTSKSIRGQGIEWWAEGLLPEGEARTVLEDSFEVRRGDTFGLLTKIGRDCAGAVTFRSLGNGDHTPAFQPISDSEIEQHISDLPLHPLGAKEDVPVSLAGLQRKLLLVRTETGWARPLFGYPSTHILKPDPLERPGLIAAEALVMKAAKLAGLDVADVELEHIGNRDVLIVTRFDRRVHDGVLQRVHQEDGCQALGINPGQGNKYERASHRDNPSYGRFAELLLNFAEDARHEQVKLAQAMVLHIASGNTDAHARNHGFLIEDGVVRCAPIYDASPTIDFSNTSRCALRVCGQELLEYVTYQHLHLEARSWLPLQNDAGAIIKDTAVRLHAAFVEAAAMIPQVPDEIVERMRNRAVRLAG